MREIRTSGSEGGAERSSVPTPYHSKLAETRAVVVECRISFRKDVLS